MTVTERFLQKVNKTATCWLWTGATCGLVPYGQFWVNSKKKNMRAHRFSYAHFVGPIPEGLAVCHRCDVPLCVNPEHLFAGTLSENMKDSVSKGRLVPPSLRPNCKPPWNKFITHCVHGHEFTAENTAIYGQQRRCRTCDNIRRKKRHQVAKQKEGTA